MRRIEIVRKGTWVFLAMWAALSWRVAGLPATRRVVEHAPAWAVGIALALIPAGVLSLFVIDALERRGALLPWWSWLAGLAAFALPMPVALSLVVQPISTPDWLVVLSVVGLLIVFWVARLVWGLIEERRERSEEERGRSEAQIRALRREENRIVAWLLAVALWFVLVAHGWRLPGARWLGEQTPLWLVWLAFLLPAASLLFLAVFIGLGLRPKRGTALSRAWPAVLATFLVSAPLAGVWVKQRLSPAARWPVWFVMILAAAVVITAGLTVARERRGGRRRRRTAARATTEAVSGGEE